MTGFGRFRVNSGRKLGELAARQIVGLGKKYAHHTHSLTLPLYFSQTHTFSFCLSRSLSVYTHTNTQSISTCLTCFLVLHLTWIILCLQGWPKLRRFRKKQRQRNTEVPETCDGHGRFTHQQENTDEPDSESEIRVNVAGDLFRSLHTIQYCR